MTDKPEHEHYYEVAQWFFRSPGQADSLARALGSPETVLKEREAKIRALAWIEAEKERRKQRALLFARFWRGTWMTFAGVGSLVALINGLRPWLQSMGMIP